MKKLIKIAIADDELLFRQGLKAILQQEKDIRVLFDAENGQELITKLKSASRLPNIIITDLKMPELNGVEVTKIIKRDYPDIKIIALTSYFSKPFVLNMISIGASAYLAKNSTPKEMLSTIKSVYMHDFYYDEKVQQFLNDNEQTKKASRSVMDSNYFTSRELDVLRLICKQYSAKDIADRLSISPRTVEVHRTNLLLKTQSKNIAGLVVFAFKNKLVDLDSDDFFD